MMSEAESVQRQMSVQDIDELRQYSVYSGATGFFLQPNITPKILASMN